jgi:hypothetical protein
MKLCTGREDELEKEFGSCNGWDILNAWVRCELDSAGSGWCSEVTALGSMKFSAFDDI